MKPYAIAIIPFLLFALAGCQPMALGEKTAHAGEKGLKVIFLYDETSADSAKSDYFNALLDIVNHSSLKRNQISVHPGNASRLASRFHLNQCPALIVKNNGVTKVRIEGRKNINMIEKKLKEVIQTTKG